MVSRRLRFAVTLAAAVTLMAGTSVAGRSRSSTAAATTSACNLGNGVQHVIHITFDNVHLFRDNANVPSDLELMPHLKHFLGANGTILSNMHTPLIAHTAQDSLALYTGLNGDRHGMAVSNSFKSYHPDGSTEPNASFAYWTSPVINSATKSASTTDLSPSMVYSPTVPANANTPNKVTPAPWVPFTRAGCSVGNFSTANMVLENTSPDINTVFGAGSPEAQQLAADPSSFKDPETADYIGEAVHCAQGDTVCAGAQGVKFGQSVASPTAATDSLPDEPGGYTGYQALFGHRYVAPQLGAGTPNVTHNGYAVTNASGNLVDLNGNEIQNGFTHAPGFPGFNPVAAESLAMVADMQEAGIPVTYGYISDLHERKAGQSGCTTSTATGTGFALGPGDSCYVQTAQAYDAAFQTFFNRLAADGITSANTIFVIGSEENDHFAGGTPGRAVQPTPTGCDGTTTPCNYTSSTIGEINANLPGLAAAQGYSGTPFDTEPQGASVYVHLQLGANDKNVRSLERAVANATANNPFSGVNGEKVVNYQADSVEQRILHIETADPLRTPTFSVFPKGDYFFGQSNCTPSCVTVAPRFAWDHGYYEPNINITWSAFAGPHVARHGIDGPGPSNGPAVNDPNGNGTVPQYSSFGTWADETDVRPTLLSLVGLSDSYIPDGRVLTEIVTNAPSTLAGLQSLGQCYKQVYASVGTFGTNTLLADTAALKTGTLASDQQYVDTEKALLKLAKKRDALANKVKTTLTDAAFNDVAPAKQTVSSELKSCNALLKASQALLP
ncbi:MAG: hypothetical protein JWL83_3064 [Actinomycetia bacterium]|nr:hypothetical protein [Actinomycetes bacterium]